MAPARALAATGRCTLGAALTAHLAAAALLASTPKATLAAWAPPARALLAALELRDPTTALHGRRVADLAARVAPDLGLDPTLAWWAGALHDIGKLGMPDIILKGSGRLTAPQRAVVRRHPLEGEALLRRAGLPPEVIAAAAQHHERPDASGYPRGLGATETSAYARLISACDVFDAVTARRTYKPARPASAGVEVLQEVAGAQLGRREVEAVLGVLQAGFEPR